MAMAGTCAFIHEPGIYSTAQIAGWKKVTDAVHEKGGRILLQIWHGGRASHPDLNAGKPAVSASAIAIDDETHTPNGKVRYTTPHALAPDEIPAIIEGFRQAALHAKDAGFDGVEVHGANGYLLDQFLRDGANLRTDQYGGSIENRARLMLEVLDAVNSVWGSDRVGLRLSLVNSFNSMIDSDPISLAEQLCQRLNEFDLAYLHIMRADFFAQQNEDVLSACQRHYRGNLIGNMGYDAAEAEAAIASSSLQAVAFGVPYLANPDLPERFAMNASLNEADPSTFYTAGAKGYTDYPLMSRAGC